MGFPSVAVDLRVIEANHAGDTAAGRRKAPATIDEWLRLGYVLGVPPESLLMPDDNSDGMFEIAPGVIIDRVQFARWLRGQAPIGEVEPRHYAQVAALTLPEDGQRSGAVAREEMNRRLASMLDLVDTETAETVRNARRQIHDLLTELDSLVTSG